MRKAIVGTILSSLLLSTALARPARAEEPAKPPVPVPAPVVNTVPADAQPKFSLNAFIAYSSIYNANGGAFFSAGPVIQQSTTGCYKNACLTAWHNYDLDLHKYNETDLTLDYTHEFADKSRMKVGYMDMMLMPPDVQKSNTQEAFLAYTLPSGLEFRFCQHFNQSDGWVLKSTYGRQVGPLSTTLIVGHNHRYWTFDGQGNDGSGNYAELDLTLPIPLSSTLTILPTVSCQRATGTLENKCWGIMALGFAPTFGK